MVVVTWRVIVTVSVVSLPPDSGVTLQTPEPTVAVMPSQLTVPAMAERERQ